MKTEPHADKPIFVLLVDSRRDHVEAIQAAFRRQNETQAERQEQQSEQTSDGRHDPGLEFVDLVTVAGIKEANRQLKTKVPDLLIADVQLTDGAGIELLPASVIAPYPVLITSSEAGEQLAVEAMKAGAIDYVVKSDANLAAMPGIAADALREWELMLEHHRLQHEVAEIPQHKQQRIGRELHDGLGQQLTGLGLLARSLVQRLTAAPKREQEMAEQLASGLEQALVEIRTLAHGLIPVQMDAHGLVSALEELAARAAKQSGIAIELRHEHPILISDNETATHVYRIVQEAINNAIKHAQARKILLILEADEDQAIIEVRDDGKGLPGDAHRKAGLGLRTMFHRCQLFGGSLDVSTHDAGGTRVRCCFPLHGGKTAL